MEGSLGLDQDRLSAFDAEKLEGEFGQCLATGTISRTREVPEDTAFVFKAVSGTAFPREIVSVPITVDGTVAAVISLGALAPYSDDALQMMARSLPSLNAAFANALADEERRRLAVALQNNNE